MESKEKNNLIFIHLFPNEDILEKISEACKKHSVETAVVLSGIGQLKQVRLGYFKEKDNYVPQTFAKPLELLSLSGNVCKSSKDIILHLHVVLGDEQKNTIGGHLLNGTVEVTSEIVLLKNSLKIKRKIDETTGLKSLDLSQ
jgi:hypothetical protein